MSLTLTFHVLLSVSLALHAGAWGDESNEWAKNGGAHERPDDNVVDQHEVAWAILVQSRGVSVEGGALLLRQLVARGVRAASLEAPDNAWDPPGEASAADTAADDASDHLTNRLVDAIGDRDDWSGSAWGKCHDEAP